MGRVGAIGVVVRGFPGVLIAVGIGIAGSVVYSWLKQKRRDDEREPGPPGDGDDDGDGEPVDNDGES